MYEDVSETLRVGLAAIITALLVGVVLTLVVLCTGLVSEQSEHLEEGIEFVNKYPPFEGIAVMEDGSLTYVDEYDDNRATENEHHPAEVVEESSSFWGYIGLGICVVGIILACRKVLLDILYAVFPFAFKVMEMGNEQQADTNYNYDDDDRYAWVDDILKDEE